MQVPLRGGKAFMSQKQLHGTKVRAAIQQVGSKGVPQRVGVRAA